MYDTLWASYNIIIYIFMEGKGGGEINYTNLK